MGQAVEKLMDTEIFFVRCSMCPNGPGADRICPPGYLDKEFQGFFEGGGRGFCQGFSGLQRKSI